MDALTASYWALPAAMLVTGLLSGVHCLGMCGGIVGAFGGAGTQATVALHARPVRREVARQLAFNGGRIASYTFAGALAGALGGAGAYVAGALSWQVALYVLANLMLILVGLYLAGALGWLARLEAVGVPLWRRLQPLAARLLPARTLPQSLAAGLVWGWIPCGLVYGALAVAVLAGSPERGALAMAAFGLGTLPNLLAAGLAAARRARRRRRRAARLRRVRPGQRDHGRRGHPQRSALLLSGAQPRCARGSKRDASRSCS
ncbi:MAG: sulfite exporter TauE/SafE family protein [Burkholderiales bacterium]|nr:sulfite exporter TauE/SafE family protein [Burkholderiales bacterium]